MDTGKQRSLVEWVNSLAVGEVIESLAQLKDGKLLLKITKIVNEDFEQRDINDINQNERFALLDSFISNQYGSGANINYEEIFLAETNEFEIAKVCLLLLSSCLLCEHQVMFVESAMKLDTYTQLNIRDMVEAVVQEDNTIKTLDPNYSQVLREKTVVEHITTPPARPCQSRGGMRTPEVYSNSILSRFNSSSMISTPTTRGCMSPVQQLVASPKMVNKAMVQQREQVRRLQRELNSEKHAHQDAEDELKQSLNTITKRETQIRELEQELSMAKRKIRQTVEEMEFVKGSAEETAVRNTRRQSRLESKEVRDMRDRIVHLERENADLYEEISEFKTQVRRLSLVDEEHSGCSQSHTRLKETIESLETRLREGEETLASVLGDNNVLSAELNKLKEIHHQYVQDANKTDLSLNMTVGENLGEVVDRIHQDEMEELQKSFSRQLEEQESKFSTQCQRLNTQIEQTLNDILKERETHQQTCHQLTEVQTHCEQLNQQLTAAKSENELLNHDLDESRAQIGQLSTDLESSKMEIDSLSEKLDASNVKINELNEALSTSQANITELSGALENSRSENSHLNEAINEASATNSKLSESLSASHAQNNELTSALTASTEKCEKLTNEVCALTEREQKVKVSLENIEEEYSNVNRALSQTQEQLNENMEIQSKLQDEICSWEEQFKLKEHALSETQSTLAASKQNQEEMYAKIEAQKGEFESLRSQFDECYCAFQKEQSFTVEKQAQIETIESEKVNMKEQFEAEIKLIETAKEALTQELNSQIQELTAELKQTEENLKSSQEEKTVLENCIEKLQREHSEAVENISSLEENIKTKEVSHGKDTDMWQSEIEYYRDNCRAAEGRLNDEMKGYNKMETEIDALNEEMKCYEQNEKEFKAKIQELEGLNSNVNLELDAFKETNSSLKQVVENSEQELCYVKQTLESTQKGNDELKIQLEQVQGQHSELLRSFENVSTELSEKRDCVQQLELQIQQTGEERDIVSSQMGEKSHAFHQLQTELGNLNEAHASITSELEIKTKSVEQLSAELEQSKQKQNAVEYRLEISLSRGHELETEIDGLHQKWDEANTALQESETNVSKLKQHSQELNNQLDERTAQLETAESSKKDVLDKVENTMKELCSLKSQWESTCEELHKVEGERDEWKTVSERVKAEHSEVVNSLEQVNTQCGELRERCDSQDNHLKHYETQVDEMNNHINMLKQKYEAETEQTQRLQSAGQKLEAHVEEMTRAHHELEQKNVQMSQNLDEVKFQLEQKSSECLTAKNKYELLESRVKDADLSSEEKGKEIESIIEKLHTAEEESVELQKRIEYLQQEKTECVRLNEKAEWDLKQMHQEEVQDFEREKRQLLEKASMHECMWAEKVYELSQSEKEIKRLKETLSSVESERDSATECVQKLGARVTELQQCLSGDANKSAELVKNLQKEVDTWKNTAEDYEDQCRELEQQLDETSQKLENTQRESTELCEQVEQYRNSVSQLEGEVSSVKEFQSQEEHVKEDLQASLADMKAKHSALSGELEVSRQKCTAMETSFESYQSKVALLETGLRNSHAEFMKETEVLKSKLEDSDSREHKLVGDLEMEKNRCASLEQQLQDVENLILDQNETTGTNQASIQETLNQTLVAREQSFRQQIKSEQDKQKELQDQLEQATSGVEEVKNELMSLCSKLTTMDEELTRSKHMCKQLENGKNNADKQVLALEDKLSMSREEVQMLNEQLEMAQNRVAKLEEDLRSEGDNVNSELRAADRREQELEVQLNQQEEVMEKHMCLYQSTQQRNRELERQVAQLNADIKAGLEDNESQRDTIEAYQEKIDKFEEELTHVRSRNQQLQQAVDSDHSKINMFHSALKQAQQESETKYKRLENEREEAQEIADKLQGQLMKKQEEQRKLSRALEEADRHSTMWEDECKKWSKEASKYSEKAKDLDTQLQLTVENSQLHAKQYEGDVKRVKEQYTRLQTKFQQTEDERKQHREQLIECEAKNYKMKQAMEEMIEKSGLIQAESEKWKKKCGEFHGMIQKLKAKNKELSDGETSRWQSKLEYTNESLQMTSSKLEDRTKECDMLKEAVDKYKSKYDKTRQMYADSSKKFEELTLTVTEYKTQVQSLEAQLHTSEGTVSTLRQQISAEEAKNKKLVNQTRSLEAQVEHASRQLRDPLAMTRRPSSQQMPPPPPPAKTGMDSSFESKEISLADLVMETPATSRTQAISSASSDEQPHRMTRSRFSLASSTTSLHDESQCSSVFSVDSDGSHPTPGLAKSATNAVSFEPSKSQGVPGCMGRAFTSDDEPHDYQPLGHEFGTLSNLTALKTGKPHLTGDEFQWGRLSELQRRNTLCMPHLKTSYPVEMQTKNLTHITDEKLKEGSPVDEVATFARTTRGRKRVSNMMSLDDSTDSLSSTPPKRVASDKVFELSTPGVKLYKMYSPSGKPKPMKTRPNGGSLESLKEDVTTHKFSQLQLETPGKETPRSKSKKAKTMKTPRGIFGGYTLRSKKAKTPTPRKHKNNENQGATGNVPDQESVAFNIGFTPKKQTRLGRLLSSKKSSDSNQVSSLVALFEKGPNSITKSPQPWTKESTVDSPGEITPRPNPRLVLVDSVDCSDNNSLYMVDTDKTNVDIKKLSAVDTLVCASSPAGSQTPVVKTVLEKISAPGSKSLSASPRIKHKGKLTKENILSPLIAKVGRKFSVKRKLKVGPSSPDPCGMFTEGKPLHRDVSRVKLCEMFGSPVLKRKVSQIDANNSSKANQLDKHLQQRIRQVPKSGADDMSSETTRALPVTNVGDFEKPTLSANESVAMEQNIQDKQLIDTDTISDVKHGPSDRTNNLLPIESDLKGKGNTSSKSDSKDDFREETVSGLKQSLEKGTTHTKDSELFPKFESDPCDTKKCRIDSSSLAAPAGVKRIPSVRRQVAVTDLDITSYDKPQEDTKSYTNDTNLEIRRNDLARNSVSSKDGVDYDSSNKTNVSDFGDTENYTENVSSENKSAATSHKGLYRGNGYIDTQNTEMICGNDEKSFQNEQLAIGNSEKSARNKKLLMKDDNKSSLNEANLSSGDNVGRPLMIDQQPIPCNEMHSRSGKKSILGLVKAKKKTSQSMSDINVDRNDLTKSSTVKSLLLNTTTKTSNVNRPPQIKHRRTVKRHMLKSIPIDEPVYENLPNLFHNLSLNSDRPPQFTRANRGHVKRTKRHMKPPTNGTRVSPSFKRYASDGEKHETGKPKPDVSVLGKFLRRPVRLNQTPVKDLNVVSGLPNSSKPPRINRNTNVSCKPLPSSTSTASKVVPNKTFVIDLAKENDIVDVVDSLAHRVDSIDSCQDTSTYSDPVFTNAEQNLKCSTENIDHKGSPTKTEEDGSKCSYDGGNQIENITLSSSCSVNKQKHTPNGTPLNSSQYSSTPGGAQYPPQCLYLNNTYTATPVRSEPPLPSPSNAHFVNITQSFLPSPSNVRLLPETPKTNTEESLELRPAIVEYTTRTPSDTNVQFSPIQTGFRSCRRRISSTDRSIVTPCKASTPKSDNTNQSVGPVSGSITFVRDGRD